MAKVHESQVDKRIDDGEFKTSDKRPAGWGRPCGAITRNNQDSNRGNCQLPAGLGTDHPGMGRCKFHGGASPRNSGRYSRLNQRKLKTLIEEHELDPKPLDLIPDLAAGRALFESYISEYDERWAALQKWANAAPEDEGTRPSVVPPDIGEARKLLAMVADLVAKVEKIKAEGAVSRQDFIRVMTEMGRVVEANVSDKDEQDKVKQGWLQIRLA